MSRTGLENIDFTLRPSAWDDYVGQQSVKQHLRILLEAAKEREHAPEHLLFYGPPGLGKTTLSHLIAKELGATMRQTSGPAIERVGDLAAILTNLEPNDVLFIDEIHRLSKPVEEILYPAMESRVLDIILGKGPSARTIQLDLPPFTIIAATTRIALLSSPLRSRFSGGVLQLSFYSVADLIKILKRSASILEVEADEDALAILASRARNTPRTANYLLKRARDVAQLNRSVITGAVAEETLRMLGVDALGLSEQDRNVLTTIAYKFNGGPVGLSTLAAATAEEEATIEGVYEPYLLQEGLIERTGRGRVLTERGRNHIAQSSIPLDVV
jgi:Holliday junction DNA helicase RuvB